MYIYKLYYILCVYIYYIIYYVYIYIYCIYIYVPTTTKSEES